MRVVLGEEAAKLSVRFDDIRNTFCRVESGDLDNVLLCRPFQLSHSQSMALIVVKMTIISLIPFIQIFVEPVKPICSCWEVCDFVSRDITRNE